MVYMDLAGMNYTVCSSDEDMTNVGHQAAQTVMHLWRNKGLLETYGDFAMDFSRSTTSFSVFAICTFHTKNQPSVLIAGGNVWGNGAGVTWHHHKKGS